MQHQLIIYSHELQRIRANWMAFYASNVTPKSECSLPPPLSEFRHRMTTVKPTSLCQFTCVTGVIKSHLTRDGHD